MAPEVKGDDGVSLRSDASTDTKHLTKQCWSEDQSRKQLPLPQAVAFSSHTAVHGRRLELLEEQSPQPAARNDSAD